ncbi:MAG: hypothetical protein ABS46_20405 [Cytophagaceae bacterium SCN 52-12]|nr:MAG: hypothetical protein ABS46_20405 [Cytophagaceae bacterium SCN 52-12]
MKKYSILLLALQVSCLSMVQAQPALYVTTSGSTGFFSETPVENISAANQKSQVVLNPGTAGIAVRMYIRDFVFPNKLMQEHFNENYMESDKFPVATFVGTVSAPPDYSQDGVYPVSAKGKFTVHGVTTTREIKGTLTVKDGKVRIAADFEVPLSDHRIEVPRLVFVKIAQVIRVKADYLLSPKN